MRASRNLSFIVAYAAVPKGRPRAARTATSIRMYTDATTKAFEARVAQVAAAAIGDAPMFSGPVHLDLQISVHPVPVAPPQGVDGVAWPASKPDLDNTEKAISDALNGIIWADDCQVCSVTKCKQYGEKPYVIITVTEL